MDLYLAKWTLTYLLEVMPKGAVLTMVHTLGNPSPLQFLPGEG